MADKELANIEVRLPDQSRNTNDVGYDIKERKTETPKFHKYILNEDEK